MRSRVPVDLVARTTDGAWTVVGRGNVPGATFEECVATANRHGPDTLQGVVRRDARRAWPDLVADAPVRLYAAGMRVWSGRVADVSGSGRNALSVSCSGWQYALDDAALDTMWVYSDLSAWRDVRSLPSADLGVWRSAAFADVDDGAIRLGWPEGALVRTGDRAGVVVDLGSSATIDIRRLSTSWARIGGATSARFRSLVFDATDTVTGSAAYGAGSLATATLTTLATPWWDVNLGVTASGTYTTAVSGNPYAGRYALLYVEWTSGDTTMAGDLGVRIFDATLYREQSTDYFSSGTTLVASTVVADVLTRCAPTLSSDRRRMGTTSFVLPHFATEGTRSAREVIDQALAYDGATFGVDAWERPVLYADPAGPTISVGAEAEWDDASVSRADDAVTAVVSEAEGPSGEMLRSWRSVALSGGKPRSTTVYAQQPTNPDFEAGTTGWVAVVGTRTASATPDTGAGSLSLTGDGSGNVEAKTASTVTLTGGRSYRVRVRVRRQAGAAGTLRITVAQDADPTTGAANRRSWRTYETALAGLTASVYATVECDVVAPVTAAVTIGVGVYAATPTSSLVAIIDGVQVLEHTDSPADRFGTGRSQIVSTGVATTWTGVAKLGDVYARTRRRAPMRGRVVVYGDTAYATSERRALRAHELLLRWGEGVSLRGTRDPWTGGLGRWGVIANVEWTDDGVATIDVDSESGGFEALLSRVGALTSRV